MALWKPFLGNRTGLGSVDKHNGYVYWCADDGSLHFDYVDAQGTLQRKQVNAKDAETLTGMSLDEIVATYTPQIVTAASTDGIAYTATVSNITALTAGVSFTMIPGRVSASTQPTLNVNGLGAKPIRRRLSSLGTSPQVGYTSTWLAVNIPFRVIYDGTQWIVEGQNKPASADLYGSVPVTKGGTGADNAVDALTNLGIYVGPDEPTDENIRIWINTSEEGTGVIPVLPRIATITLSASAWTGSSNPWSQVVTVNGVSVNSKIDLQPTAQQIVALQEADIALMAENNNGVVTIYALGGKPTVDYTMQVLLTEVAYV